MGQEHCNAPSGMRGPPFGGGPPVPLEQQVAQRAASGPQAISIKANVRSGYNMTAHNVSYQVNQSANLNRGVGGTGSAGNRVVMDLTGAPNLQPGGPNSTAPLVSGSCTNAVDVNANRSVNHEVIGNYNTPTGAAGLQGKALRGQMLQKQADPYMNLQTGAGKKMPDGAPQAVVGAKTQALEADLQQMANRVANARAQVTGNAEHQDRNVTPLTYVAKGRVGSVTPANAAGVVRYSGGGRASGTAGVMQTPTAAMQTAVSAQAPGTTQHHAR